MAGGSRAESSELRIDVPAWQIAVVLLLPGLFLINARMPWATRLWVDLDKSYFYAFWLSILGLYVVCASLVLLFMRLSQVTLSDIGFRSSVLSALIVAGVLTLLGVLAILFRIAVPYDNTDSLGFQIGWPETTPQRLFWIPIYISAGFFEEFIYRGFAIPALIGKHLSTWLVVLVTSTAFSLIHGGADWIITGLAFVWGLVFATIFLWRRRLLPVMSIHAMADWTFLLLP